MVVSGGVYICAVCDKRFPNEEDLTNHRSDAHDKANAANDSAAEDIDETSNSVVVNDEDDESDMFDSEDDQDLNQAFEELLKILASQEAAVEN